MGGRLWILCLSWCFRQRVLSCIKRWYNSFKNYIMTVALLRPLIAIGVVIACHHPLLPHCHSLHLPPPPPQRHHAIVQAVDDIDVGHDDVTTRRQMIVHAALGISTLLLLPPPIISNAVETPAEAVRLVASKALPGLVGPADIYYPSYFIGKWKVTRRITESEDTVREGWYGVGDATYILSLPYITSTSVVTGAVAGMLLHPLLYYPVHGIPGYDWIYFSGLSLATSVAALFYVYRGREGVKLPIPEAGELS